MNAPVDLHESLKPRILPRPRDAAVEQRALAEGLTPLQARILAGRLGGYEANWRHWWRRACVIWRIPNASRTGGVPPSALPGR